MLADLALEFFRQARGEAWRGQVQLFVEQRERGFLGSQLSRCGVGLVAHDLCDLRAHRARCLGVIAQAEHNQRIAEAGEAQTNAALVHRFDVLLRQRPLGDLEHVVEHADRRPYDFAEGFEIEARLGGERVGHEAGQVDAAEAAAAVRGKRLFAAIVNIEAIGIESVHVRDADVKYFFFVVAFDAFDCRSESFPIEPALVRIKKEPQPSGFFCMAKSDRVFEALQICRADDQLMDRLCRVPRDAAFSVRQQFPTGGLSIPIDRRGDAESQQHALNANEILEIDLCKTYADPFGLSTLHRPVGIKETTQEASVEFR